MSLTSSSVEKSFPWRNSHPSPQTKELFLPTNIDYQVARHLMFKGEVEKGLGIIRECRKRFDGTIHNPFNEYECGNWYAPVTQKLKAPSQDSQDL